MATLIITNIKGLSFDRTFNSDTQGKSYEAVIGHDNTPSQNPHILDPHKRHPTLNPETATDDKSIDTQKRWLEISSSSVSHITEGITYTY